MSEISRSGSDEQSKASDDSRADAITILVVILTTLSMVVYWVGHQV